MAVTYPLADATICVSEGVREDLENSLGLNSDVTTMIYNAVITPEIRRMYREQVSHPWLSSDIPVVMGLGSLTLQKDFATLIRAVNVLQQTRECRLIIAGAGSQKKKLEALIDRLGMSDIADLPGFVDNPYAMMRQAEVFVLSSKWEGFGNVLVEALGCGCPVVSTDCPSGPAEILVGGKYGKLVPVGDEHRMADAIASQIDNPPSADRLRTRAEMFSLETIAEEYLDTLFDQ
jgi:glycosyltransferase involved in cell wall biosynthesis